MFVPRPVRMKNPSETGTDRIGACAWLGRLAGSCAFVALDPARQLRANQQNPDQYFPLIRKEKRLSIIIVSRNGV